MRVFIFLMLISYLPGTSQITNQQNIIDTYIKTGTRDTSFVNKVIQLALANPLNEDMLVLLTEAIKVAKQKQYDEGLVQCYSATGKINTRKGNLEEAKTNYLDAKEIYEQRKDQENLAKVHCDLAQVYRKQGELDVALENFQIALEIDHENSLNAGTQITIFRGFTGIYRLKQDFTKAINYMQKALEVSMTKNDPEIQSHIYSSLGNIYLDIKNNEEAIKNHQLALLLFQQNKDTINIANTLSNMSMIFTRESKLKKADSIYNQALDLCLAADLKEGQIGIYRGLGIVATARGEYKNSIEYHLKSLAIAEGIKDRRSMQTAYQNLGIAYGEQGDFAESLQYFEKSKEQATQLKDTVLLRLAYNNLSYLNKLMGDFETAYNYHLDFYDIEKQEIKKIQEAANQASSMKTKIFEKEKEMKEKEMIQVKINNRNLTVIVVLSLLLFFASLYAFIRIRKLNKKLENKNNQLVYLNKEMHHRVKNNLQAISSFIYLNYRKITDQKLKNILSSIRSQIVSIGQIHKLLYQGEKDFRIDAEKFFENLTKEITGLQTDIEKPVQIKKLIHIDNFSINFDKAVQIGLIINELITNAFKYAFIDHPNPVLDVKIETIENESLYIEIKDNGPGMSTNTQEGQSFGLDLIDSLVQQDQWEFSSSTETGCTYTLIIPLNEIEKKNNQ